MFFFPWYPAMMLAVEASNVIDLRLWKIARGGQEAATESHLMVKEKIDALFEAGSVLADGGKVTLTGSVSSRAERDEAENAAWGAPGVTDVKNSIVINYAAAATASF